MESFGFIYSKIFKRSLLLIFLLITTCDQLLAGPSQTTPSIQKLDVDPTTGTAVTSYGVNVPQGRGGIQPNITFLYNSSSPNGLLGQGWLLDLGSIERSTKRGSPSYTNNDTFVFMQSGSSQELVDISGNGTEFRPKLEGAFMKMQFVNGSYWLLTDKKGTKYYFGQTTGSQEYDPSNTSHVFHWALDYVVDVNGNDMTLSYVHYENRIYPDQIVYTGNPSQGKSPFGTVKFSWEDRIDTQSFYIPGFELTLKKRLKTITTSVSGNLFSQYVMNYSQGQEIQTSILTSITPYGADGISTLPATNFSYSPTYTYNVVRQNLNNYPSVDMSTGKIKLLDMDKDGLLDMVDGSTSGAWKVYNQVNGSNQFNAAQAVSNSPTVALDNPDVRLVDLNGDGLIDIVYGVGGSYKTWLNNGTNSFTGPINATNSPSVNFSNQNLVQLVDMNHDGLPDLVETYTGTNGTYKIYFNQGNGNFTGPTNAINSPTHGTNDGNVQWVDINGDGWLDIVYGVGCPWTVWINNGQNGFNPSQAMTGSCVGNNIADANYTTQFMDLNNDGLVDAIVTANSGSPNNKIVFNNGRNGFTASISSANFPGVGFNNAKLQMADMNGDGLMDLVYGVGNGGWDVYLNTGMATGFGPRVPLGNYPSGDLDSTNYQLADINGDNKADVFAGTGAYQVYLTNNFNPTSKENVLVTIDNGMGATTQMTYGSVKIRCLAGNAFRNAFNTFFFMTVQTITQTTAQGDSYTTSYSYKKCSFDYPSREFRGFGNVRVTDPLGNYTDTNYAQDDIYKGRVLDQSTYDVNGNLFSKTVNTWNSQTIYPNVIFAFLQRVDNFVYDGNATGRRTAEEYFYGESSQYGNLTKVIQHGEVNLTDGSEVGSDTRSVETTYGNSTTNWLLGFPQSVTVKDNGGNVVRQTWFYYDGATGSTTLPTKGLLTAKQEWGGPSGVNPTMYFSYDAFGNLKTTTDPRNNVTTITYDSNFVLFPITTTNALNQSISNEYYGVNGVPLNSNDGFYGLWGQLKSTTDPNNQKGTTSYDVFGRPIFMVGPADSVTYPTTLIDYQINPMYSKVTTHSRQVSGQAGTIDSYDFYDGLGRLIQSKRPDEVSGQYIVSGQTQYNSRGLPQRKYLPFFSTNSLDTIETIDAMRPYTAIIYDAMGRVVQTTNPDNTFTSVSYDDWLTTSVDENGHEQKSYFDAYGRLIKKEEYTGADGRSATYPASAFTLYAATQYNYDSEGNLVQTIDAKNNTTTITYDNLGRKTKMVDPDMGTWNYTYDTSGNLATQTDARNQKITFSYDALNRLTNKTDGTGAINVNYTYGSTATSYSKGRITQASYANGNTTFNYDPLGREIKSTKTIDSSSYTVERTYDALSRLTSLKYPDSTMLYYTYNASGEVETVTNIPPGGGSQPSSIPWDVSYSPQSGTTPDKVSTNAWVRNVTTPDYTFAHWRLNDNAANTIVTDVGSGLSTSSANVNTSTLAQTGKLNGAFQFNGTSQYVMIDNFLSRVSSDAVGSFSVWVKPSGDGTILGFGSSSGNLQLQYTAATQNVTLTVSNAATVLKCSTPNGSVTLNNWTHIVVVQNGTAPQIYVNNWSQTLSYAVQMNKGAWFSTAGMSWGRMGAFTSDGNTHSSYFKGMIDEVRYYKRAISSSEVGNLYSSSYGIETQTSSAYLEPDAQASNGTRLTIETGTSSNYTLSYAHNAAGSKWVSAVNPSVGYTFETRLKVINTFSGSAVDLKFADGSKQFMLRISGSQIQIPSGYLAEGSKSYSMTTTDTYHTYWLSVQGTLLKVYVDGTAGR